MDYWILSIYINHYIYYITLHIRILKPMNSLQKQSNLSHPRRQFSVMTGPNGQLLYTEILVADVKAKFLILPFELSQVLRNKNLLDMTCAKFSKVNSE